MNTLQEYKPQIRHYLFENIDNFEIRVALAWDVIDKWRCPLSFADSQLFNEMYDYFEEWLRDEFEKEQADEILANIDECFIEELM